MTEAREIEFCSRCLKRREICRDCEPRITVREHNAALAAKDAKLAELTRVYEQNELLLRRLLKDERDKSQKQAAEIERLKKWLCPQMDCGCSDGCKMCESLRKSHPEKQTPEDTVKHYFPAAITRGGT